MQQVAEGEQLTYLSNNEGFLQTFTHLDYANGFRVTRRMYRDDLYGLMEQLATELSLSADSTEETILANHFNRAENSSYTGADGVELSSAAHVREDGTTYSNELSSAADLSQTSLEQAFIDFSDQRSGGGRRLTIQPKCLVVPKEEGFNADRLLNSRQAPEDNTNAINPIQGKVDVLVWHFLTDADRTFLVADKSNHGLKLYTREELWTDYEYDFDTSDYKVKASFAQSSGWTDPRGFFCLRGA
jgi:phage major head subunit gpT-like protein